MPDPSVPDQNISISRLWTRKLWAEVEEETTTARGAFLPSPIHLDRDLPPPTYWISVIVEEIGKLARCCNKMSITDGEEKQRWIKEGHHCIITSMSLLRRLAERWEEISNK